MEEKKIKLTCDLCENRGKCNTGCTSVCANFAMDKEAIEALIKKTVAKTTGLTWEEAEKEALAGHCIRRKAWGKEAFVWRREMRALSADTNDPYVREACRRAGVSTLPEGACFAKLDYDSRFKGLPRIILHWMPTDENDVNATDWEVFDVPNTYGNREVKVESTFEHIFHNPGKYSDREILNLMKGIFPEKFCRCRPRGCETAMPISSYEEFFKDLHRVGSIMDDLDKLLK